MDLQSPAIASVLPIVAMSEVAELPESVRKSPNFQVDSTNVSELGEPKATGLFYRQAYVRAVNTVSHRELDL